MDYHSLESSTFLIAFHTKLRKQYFCIIQTQVKPTYNNRLFRQHMIVLGEAHWNTGTRNIFKF